MRELRPGDVVAGYRIEALVARGGTGEVYRALDPRRARSVALKVIYSELADDAELRSRRERAARLALQIDHPNVIPVFDVGEADGLLYIAMQFVDGTDLAAVLLREPRIEPRRAARVVAAAASGLDAMHARGLVHTELRPGEILLVEGVGGEHVYLSGFGIAEADTARSASWIGNPAYISPEQVRGKPLDARTDTYSLGCILFQMLTGRLPHERDSDVGVLFAKVHDPVPPVRALAPDVPPELEAVIRRAMAREPQERFASAGDMGRAALAAAEPARAPEGWYADPSGDAELRHWDGTRWTDRTAKKGGPGEPAGWYADPGGEAQLRYWDGTHWMPLASLAEAQTSPDAVVIMTGDLGEQIYLTIPARYVRCTEQALYRLARDLDRLARPANQGQGASVRFQSRAVGSRLGGGTGGASVVDGLWIREDFDRLAIGVAIREVLAGSRLELPSPHRLRFDGTYLPVQRWGPALKFEADGKVSAQGNLSHALMGRWHEEPDPEDGWPLRVRFGANELQGAVVSGKLHLRVGNMTPEGLSPGDDLVQFSFLDLETKRPDAADPVPAKADPPQVPILAFTEAALAAKALFNKAARLAEAGRLEEALAVGDEVVARFGDAHEPALRQQVAQALVYKSATLGRMGRAEDALAVCDDVVARFGEARELAVRQQVASALFNKGVALEQLGRLAEAVGVYNEVVARFGGADEPAVREPVAAALINKGIALGEAGRTDEAVAAYDELVARLGEAPEPVVRERVAWALVNKGVALEQLGHLEEAVAVYNELVVRVGEASEPAVREQVAKTLFNKGVALGRLGRFEEAVAVYDEVVARFGEASEPAVREQVANALINKGAALGRLGRFEEKLAVYDDVVARFGQAREPAVREQVASALFNKGLALTQAERLAEEVAVYDELVARFGQAREPAVREQVAQALFYKGVRLAELGRVQEAVAVYDEVVARFGEATEPALRDVVRKARASGNEAEAERARLPLPADTAATMLRLPFAVEDLAYEAGRVWLVPSERPGLFYIRATSEAADLRFLPLAAKVKFVAAGWGAIWATCEDHVVRRIDPATVEVAGEAKGPELDYFGMAAGAGAVWISCSKDSIARIDPAALEHRLIDTGPGWRDYRFALELQGLDAGPKDVWVAAIHNDSIVRVDATKLSFKVLRVTEPAGTGRGMEVSPSVPLTDASPLERLDEALHDRSAWRTELPIGPVDVAATADAVWVSGIWNDLLYKPARTPGVVVQLDQAGRLLSESTVGRRPLSLVASPNSVWVANYDDGTVMRIDRGSPEPRPSWIDVGPGPKALAIGGGAIWVATEVGVGRIAEADVG